SVNLHIAVPPSFKIRADKLVRIALEDFDDLAFAVSAANVALSRNGNEHGVARGWRVGVVSGDENIAGAIGRWSSAVGANEPIAGAHAAEDARDTLAGEFFARDAAGEGGLARFRARLAGTRGVGASQ